MTPVTNPRRAAPLPPDERRRAIVDAVLPVMVARGPNLTTREIAEAADVSEGTLFNVFDDKDALVDAVIDAAIDPAATEAAIAEIDRSLPLDEQLTIATTLLHQRSSTVWRLVSEVPRRHPRPGNQTRMPDNPRLIELFADNADQLRIDPIEAARRLRSITFACTHPLLRDEPMTARDIVDQFLHGCVR
jgi:AcrR family transcriptional regulator